MLRVGLTGGIACGKSTATRLLKEMEGDHLRHFDADAAVAHHLKDPQIAARICEMLEIKAADNGALNKSELRHLIFHNLEARRRLEGLLHPLVREDCLASMEEAEQSRRVSHFIGEIPLLYEASGSYPFDITWVVACSRSSQVERLKCRLGLDSDLVIRILEAQWPIERKILKGDRVLWNEGPEKILKKQLRRLLCETFET